MRPLHIKLLIINTLFKANTDEANELIERVSRLIYEPDFLKWVKTNKKELKKYNLNL